jgi:hypothetical protein
MESFPGPCSVLTQGVGDSWCARRLARLPGEADPESNSRRKSGATPVRRCPAPAACLPLEQVELPGAFSPEHDREVSAYVDGEISAAELYRRTVSRYRRL